MPWLGPDKPLKTIPLFEYEGLGEIWKINNSPSIPFMPSRVLLKRGKHRTQYD